MAAALSIRRAGMAIAIPFATACLFGAACFLFAIFSIAAPNYLTSGNLQQLMRDFAEPCMVAIAMAITILAGGFDLSIGAIFALANFTALFLFRIHGLPLEITIPAVLAVGLLIGSVNGLLVAYLRLKPFLSTLAVLMILRAGYDLTAEAYTTELAIAVHDTTAWRFLGWGVIVGVPVNTIALLVVGAAAQFFLTRLQPDCTSWPSGQARRPRAMRASKSRARFFSPTFSAGRSQRSPASFTRRARTVQARTRVSAGRSQR